MKFLTATASLVLAVSSVSAAIGPKVVACSDAIKTANAQFAVVDDGFYNWKVADGISGLSAAQTEEGKLEENIQAATNACSTVDSPFTAEEADSIVALLKHHSIRVTATVHSFIYKHDDFIQDPEVTNLVTKDLQNLNELNDKFESSIIASTPATHLPQAKDSIAKMDTAFDDAYLKYGLK